MVIGGISWIPCAICGTFVDVKLYPAGHRCPLHTPAAGHGHPEPPEPDPKRTIDALRARPRADRTRNYGTATDDPLGRTVEYAADGRRLSIPKYPCPDCADNGPRTPIAGHKGDHRL